VKKTITAVAFTLLACTAAHATGLSPTLMDPQVIAADTSSTALDHGPVLALLTTVFILLGGLGAF
jgi:hypothetical protein